MRIVIDLQSCQNGSRYRGIGRYAIAMTKAMIAQRGGHEILVFLTDRYPEAVHAVRRQLDGILPPSSIFVCSLFANTEANNPDNAWRTRAAEIVRTEFLAALVPDIVFVPSLFEGFCDDVVTSIDPAPFRTAVTLHDFIPLEDPARHLSGQHDWNAYARKARDLRRADLMVAISSYTAESAIRFLEVDPARIVIIHNGVEERFRPPEYGERKPSLDQLSIRQPFVFNTSPLEHRKNLEGLIAGFARMSRRAIDDHQLVIAGNMTAPERAYLSDLADGAGLPEGKLVLTGYLSDQDLAELYGRCELFVFPSFSEGFGLPPLEAMACGAPVIASCTTSIPEVIGRTDSLFDPTDRDALGVAIERVLTNPALARELRDFSLERASLFSWHDAAARLLKAFELMPSRAGTSPAQSAFIPPQGRLAVVLPAASDGSAIAGKCASLALALELVAEITILREPNAPPEPWLDATFDRHDLDWLDRNAARFDAIVYIAGTMLDEAVAKRMTVHPGILLRLCEPEAASDSPLAPTLPHAKGSIDRLDDTGPDAADAQIDLAHVQRLPPTAGCLVLEEGDLPTLPVSRSHRAAIDTRRRFGISAETPLIIAFVHSRGAEEELGTRLDDAITGGVALLLHRVLEPGAAVDNPLARPKDGRIHRVTDDLTSCYRGLISAADIILVAGVSFPIMKQLEVDVRALGIPLIADANHVDDLAQRVFEVHLAPGRKQSIVGPASDPALARWVAGVDDAVTRWRARRPSMLHRVASRLPAAVRDIWPNATDVRNLAASVAANAALARAVMLPSDLPSASPDSQP